MATSKRRVVFHATSELATLLTNLSAKSGVPVAEICRRAVWHTFFSNVPHPDGLVAFVDLPDPLPELDKSRSHITRQMPVLTPQKAGE